MILERHKWLLRTVETAFDSTPLGAGFPCRVCRVKDRGEIVVSLASREQHLAQHRREKIVKQRDEPLFLEPVDG